MFDIKILYSYFMNITPALPNHLPNVIFFAISVPDPPASSSALYL